jgi:Xaa-Pro aminopeptidase
MNLEQEKLTQAAEILRQLDIDLWLTFVRETGVTHDPSLDMILGTGCTWQSVFIVTAGGETIGLVGSLDKAGIETTGLFKELTGYVKGIDEELIKVLERLDPKKIAINYSLDTPVADGLTHGMYLKLMEYLDGTPWADRLVSAEPVIAALRGRKSSTELSLIEDAIAETVAIFGKLNDHLRHGMTEKEAAAFVIAEREKTGLPPAWDEEHCPAIFTGPESAGAHAGPTDRPAEPGHVLNIDFGVKKNGYCSDLQRTWYFLREGETEAPAEVVRGFQTVLDAVSNAAEFLKPGVLGWEVDDRARSHITGAGYEEYPHALGHQVGRVAHDGGGLLCPQWERYGQLPYLKVEEGQVYTLEPRLQIPGHGVATIEEIVVVTADGCRWLSPRQTELWLVPFSR